MDRVALTASADYEKNTVKEAVDRLFALAPPPVSPGQRVFLKVNLLLAKNPSAAVTTHPALVGEVASRLIAMGCEVTVGDSPGGPFNQSILQRVYRICGMTAMAEEVGCRLNFDTSSVNVELPSGRRGKAFPMVRAMVEADCLISMAKLKTHGMMLYSGAAKNMYGTIPGATKAQYHLNMPDYEDFARLLVDICQAAAPEYSIIDGIWGMEGNGPSGGSPKYVGALLAGINPFAVDYVGASLMGLSPETVPMLKVVLEEGLLTGVPEILGNSLADFKHTPFLLPETKPVNLFLDKLPGFLSGLIDAHTRPWPEFGGESCNGCGICRDNCPPGAIRMVEKRPQVDLTKCIRCFCCHELCPQTAIRIKKRWISRLLDRL